MHAHLAIHPCSSLFLLTQGSFGAVSPPLFFLWYVSPSRFGLLGIFLIIIHPCWGYLKMLGICWVWNSRLWICCVYFSLTWAVVLHFLEAENFIFVILLWLGFFPNDFCCISPMFSKLKIVFVFPDDLEERPHPLGCCCWFHFWPLEGQNVPWIWFTVSGLFLPSLAINFVAELFSSTQKWCILLCMQFVFGLCRSGKESAWQT